MKSIFLAFALLGLFSAPSCFAGEFVTHGSTGTSGSRAPYTALQKYKQYVYAIVGSYWFPEVNQSYGSIPAGTVQIKFVVHSDGTLTDISVLNEGKGDGTILKKLSTGAMEAGAPFRPFNEALIKEVGKSYTDTFSFTIPAKDK